MKKTLKYGLLGLLLLLALIVATISYVTLTVNPNDYKLQIIEWVRDKQERTLKLDGDIKLTFFPRIGVKLEKISLSEYRSNKEFAAIASAHVSLALLPLLYKQVVVSEVVFNSVRVDIAKFKDGSSNFDDLLGKQEVKEEATPQTESKPDGAVKFDIASVTITNTALSYRDESSGARYALKELNLKTGRIAYGVPGKINFDALIQANIPKLDIATKLQAILTFDVEKNSYQVEGMEFQLKGSVLDMSDVLLTAKGDAGANLETSEFTASKLKISIQGVKGKDKFDASLDMPTLIFTTDKVAVEKLVVNANLDGEAGKMIAALTLRDLQGNTQSFKSAGITLDIELKQAQQAYKVKLSTPVVGSLEAQQLNLSNLVFALNATGDNLPNKSISSEMKGSVQVDGERESVQLNLVGGLLQSQVNAKLALKGFSNPAIRFDVNVDQFDADLFLPKKSVAAPVKDEVVPEQPFDLSGLQKLNLNGSLRIGTLKVANIKSSMLRVDVKANKGLFIVSPLSANLYQGSMNGSIEVNAMHAPPIFMVKQNLNGVLLGSLLKDAVDLDIVEGSGNVNANLATQGNTVTQLKKGLHGTLLLNMENGALKGINLSKLVHGATNVGQSSVATLKPVSGDKTDFTDFKASFKLDQGVARNDDLLVKSQSLRVTGKGAIDIGNSSINYSSRTTVADSVDAKSGSITVPVQVIGPFADLKFKVDYAAVAVDVAKQKLNSKVEVKKEEAKQQLQEKLKGGLQKLFK